MRCLRLLFVWCIVLPLPAPTFAQDAPKTVTPEQNKRVWGEPVYGQAISISTEKEEYASGESILLQVRLKNVGTEGVPSRTIDPRKQFELTVLSPNGKQVPLTAEEERQRKKPSRHGAKGGTLKPGREKVRELELSRIFDMTVPAKYTVVVQERVWKEGSEKPMKAISNRIEIAVVNRPAKEPP